MILQVNCTREKPRVRRKLFFFKLDVRRRSIVTLALSQDNRQIIVVRYFVNRAPGFLTQIRKSWRYNRRRRLRLFWSQGNFDLAGRIFFRFDWNDSWEYVSGWLEHMTVTTADGLLLLLPAYFCKRWTSLATFKYKFNISQINAWAYFLPSSGCVCPYTSAIYLHGPFLGCSISFSNTTWLFFLSSGSF